MALHERSMVELREESSCVKGRAIAAAILVLVAGGLRASPQPRAADSVTFVGAGDIAECKNLEPARATGQLLDSIDGTIFTLGDHAYTHGNAREFRDCYGPTWGRHKDRTRPAIGNHEMETDGGRPYFEYFGENAGPDRRGYYSFELGAWHVVSLDSEASMKLDSPQVAWLRQDLAEHPTDCALAYWHTPRFASTRKHDSSLSEIWSVLYDAGVDVVLNGHEHAYERFAPQDAQGRADPSHGIRQFIVGTGGGKLNTIRRPAPNVEAHEDHTFGVLKLTLKPHGYAWEFVPVAGQHFSDAGAANCSASR